MNATNTKAYIALAIVCFVWGTTYLAIRIGVATFPPFLYSAIRQLLAGGLMFVILRLSGISLRVTTKEIKQQALAGVLLLALGNGLIAWAERYIPSGLAALVVAIMPVYVALISLTWAKTKEKLNTQIITGMLLGCVGLVFIFRDNLSDLANKAYLAGIAVALFASLCWAFGTVYTKQNRSGAHAFVNAAIQMCSGGVALLVFSACFDNYAELSSISSDSIWALAYLIVFGSIISYGSYLFALERLPAGLTSIYAYINPVVALLLGYFILDEKLTWFTGLACLSIGSGVYLMNRGYTVNRRALATISNDKKEKITIIQYKPDLQPYFESLNKAWIQQSFRIEPVDEWVLTQPEAAILKAGGSILFAQKGNDIIGTVAIRRVDEESFEMTKMAVDERFRGAGAGKKLIEAAIIEATKAQASKLILYSNTGANGIAIQLYRKMGFIEIPLEPGRYERADIKMQILLPLENRSTANYKSEAVNANS
jgi:drug/metabolite transporter (DMT)-like permease/ribosomal protein S18 acetylase RimI-like enzyme